MTVSHLTGSSNGVAPLSSNVNALPELTPPDRRAEHSRFVQRVRRRYPDELGCLPPGEPVRATMQATLSVLVQRGLPMPAALRVLRQLVLERLVVLDCEQGASLQAVTRAVTELAEIALDAACELAFKELDELFGAPRHVNPEGETVRAQLWVVGMGKLGARELNVSSDIDLIYVYDHDGETAGNAQGRNRISNHEYFGKAVKHIYNSVGETTEHGNVFRVDLALRPNGNSGPSAVSLGALEEYFLVQGREWERFAWLKSRVIAPAACIKAAGALALRGVVLPFVFRRYLDYGVFESLRTLHRQIRDHASKRAAGNPGRANDVKLSRGGIREVEFTVQLLQVVRGGQFPELRTRPTLDALPRLCRAGLMPQTTADALARGLPVPAPGRAPHPVPGRPANACDAHARRRPGVAGRHHGLCQPVRVPARAGCAPRTGGAGVRHAAGRPHQRRLQRQGLQWQERSNSARWTICSTCWLSCRGRLPPRWRSGANTRACWRCKEDSRSAWYGWCSAPVPGSKRAA